MNVEDQICEEVLKFWNKEGVREPVIAFFDMKYAHEVKWEHYSELITDNTEYDADEVTVCFENDFWEGQQDVKNIKIVGLDKIIERWVENDNIR